MYSTTYTATLVLLLTALARVFNVDVMPEELQATVETLFIIGSSVWILIERFRKGGINALGFRR
jgi:hypothetical protein